MLLCRNGFLKSTRRLFTGSLTLALAYPLMTVAQDRACAERFADHHSGTVAALLHRHRPGSRALRGFRDVQAGCRHRPRHVVQAGDDRASRGSDTADRATTDRDDADDEQRLPHRRQQPAERQRRRCLRPAPVHRASSQRPPTSASSASRAPSRTWRSTIRSSIPVVPGAAHLHTFFGNTGTNAVEHRAVDPRHRQLDLSRRDDQSLGVLGAVDDRHVDRQADRSRRRSLLLQAGLHPQPFERRSSRCPRACG